MEIRVLGEIQVVRDGAFIPLPPSKKTRALLGYLAATDKPTTRARLCDLLWEGPDDPRAALRWSLTKLRRLLERPTGPEGAEKDDARGTGVIATALEHVRLASERASVDILEHRLDLATPLAELETTTLIRAAARFRGDFLEGIDLPDCYRFHEWCVSEREALRRDRIALLSELVRRFRSEPEAALVHARLWVAVDPVAEAPHAAVIRLLGQLGRRREAQDQYDRCRQLLRSENRLEVPRELEAARAALGSDPPRPAFEGDAPHAATEADSPAARDAAGASQPAASSDDTLAGYPRAPLLGREREWEALHEAVTEARRGGAPGPISVLGDPGLGKTRLLTEVATFVRREGDRCLVGRAFEVELTRPYGPWVDALRAVPLTRLPAALRAELAPLLPELSDTPAASRTDRPRLFDAVVRLLGTLRGEDHALVVVLDDVQWLDEASAALLHFACRARIPGVVLAVAARPGEIDDNPWARRLFRALRRERGLTELRLRPLSAKETAALVLSVAPHADVATIHAGSEGNPLFALELGRAAALGSPAGALPPTLGNLLRDRLERLSASALGLVTWAAVLGRSFELSRLVTVSGIPTPEVLNLVDDLDRRGLLRTAPAGTTQFGYDFSHDLVRRAAYDRLPGPRRALCHAHVANVLSARLHDDDAVAGDVAHHAALGGNDALAQRACASAARRSVRLFAYGEAVELADRGRHHGAKLSRSARLPFEIELLGVLVHTASLRRAAEIEDALTSAISTADAMGNPDLVTSGYHALSMLHHYRGDIPRAADTVQLQADSGRAATPAIVVRALANAGRCYAMVGRNLPRARELLAEAQGLAERHGLVQVELDFGRACLHQFDGEIELSAALFERTLAAVRDAGDHWQECECLVRMTTAAIDRQDYREAEARSEELSTVASRMDRSGSEAQVAAALVALTALGKGELGAAPAVEASIGTLRALDTKGMLGYLLASAARMALDAGEPDAAARRIEEAMANAQLSKSDDDVLTLTALLAEVSAARGDAAEARRRLKDAEHGARDGDTVSARSRQALERARERVMSPRGSKAGGA